MILLDTNFLIYALKGDTPQNHHLREWIGRGEIVGISSTAWAEFLCGPVSEADRLSAEQIFPDAQPLLKQDAVLGAHLFNATGRRRGSLADCLIAAICVRLDASLATENTVDFERFAPMGLRIVSVI